MADAHHAHATSQDWVEWLQRLPADEVLGPISPDFLAQNPTFIVAMAECVLGGASVAPRVQAALSPLTRRWLVETELMARPRPQSWTPVVSPAPTTLGTWIAHLVVDHEDLLDRYGWLAMARLPELQAVSARIPNPAMRNICDVYYSVLADQGTAAALTDLALYPPDAGDPADLGLLGTLQRLFVTVLDAVTGQAAGAIMTALAKLVTHMVALGTHHQAARALANAAATWEPLPEDNHAGVYEATTALWQLQAQTQSFAPPIDFREPLQAGATIMLREPGSVDPMQQGPFPAARAALFRSVFLNPRPLKDIRWLDTIRARLPGFLDGRAFGSPDGTVWDNLAACVSAYNLLLDWNVTVFLELGLSIVLTAETAPGEVLATLPSLPLCSGKMMLELTPPVSRVARVHDLALLAVARAHPRGFLGRVSPIPSADLADLADLVALRTVPAVPVETEATWFAQNTPETQGLLEAVTAAVRAAQGVRRAVLADVAPGLVVHRTRTSERVVDMVTGALENPDGPVLVRPGHVYVDGGDGAGVHDMAPTRREDAGEALVPIRTAGCVPRLLRQWDLTCYVSAAMNLFLGSGVLLDLVLNTLLAASTWGAPEFFQHVTGPAPRRARHDPTLHLPLMMLRVLARQVVAGEFVESAGAGILQQCFRKDPGPAGGYAETMLLAALQCLGLTAAAMHEGHPKPALSTDVVLVQRHLRPDQEEASDPCGPVPRAPQPSPWGEQYVLVGCMVDLVHAAITHTVCGVFCDDGTPVVYDSNLAHAFCFDWLSQPTRHVQGVSSWHRKLRVRARTGVYVRRDLCRLVRHSDTGAAMGRAALEALLHTSPDAYQGLL
jgi:hypothetical protein